MKPWLAASPLVGLLFLGATAPAQAQRSHIGPHAGYNFDIERAYVGAQLLRCRGRPSLPVV
jgi:hypothetical protein